MALPIHDKQTVRGNVLVADDDIITRKMLTRMLEAHGHRVTSVPDGYEAVEALNRDAYDLVLLDLMMPRMNGYDVLEQIRFSVGLMDLPVIIISARVDAEDVVQGLNLGANDYVTKPFDLNVVRARVNTQLWLKRLMADNRKQIEDLETLHTMRARLMRIASHDLKNPVSNIQMAEYVLRERIKTQDPEIHQVLDAITTSLNTMQEVINQFLNMAVLKVGNAEVELTDINLRDTVWEVMMQYMVSALNKSITLDFSETEGTVYGDVSQFKQALGNLVSNAIKYTPPTSHVTVFTQSLRDSVRICVVDEGPGIPENERAHLFKEFCTLSPRPTGGESSNGLGLWIAHHLMERQHGAIGAEFPEDGGSVFWIELPRQPARNPHPETTP